ncbi:cytochrome b [Rhodoblastus acidophilus]|uniref:Cytochrome b n=1 Tax=Candidatus Rhodoblastus alkanivorans TaxID=2954117 RepID=A0ABS9Z2E1_9HYPH|nr:cytochrome b [Candidatus Rhodoblastus alkanivorans]MCI4678023.1 cytochrome b [Candidatus Rhodoblastus alkanivorans]MCI4681636.1 cytochrome b [Candidatus Rhodoblastus alkanivorans]MDI4642684.1 cytochrome b [Rhodoblastus acidophilus]
MNVKRYNGAAIALHWTIAGLIVVAFVLGLTIDDFPKDMKSAAINAHALIGLAVLALSVVRLYLRFVNPPPPLPESIGPLSRLASGATHAGLYVLMIAVPLIGVPTLLYRGRGFNFGLFAIPSPFGRTPEIYRPLTEAHEVAAYAIIGLAAAHALAALYHQYVRKDDVLLRMLPGSWRREG